MHVFFDESGDYGFIEGSFDCYVQAAVICPDQLLSSLQAFVDRRCLVWGVNELHASELCPQHLDEIADFLGRTQVELTAQLTDTDLAPRQAIEAHRLSQANA